MCDKRLSRLISYIHHTCEYKQHGHVGNTAKQCRLGLFQDSDFARDLEDSTSTSGGTLCVFASRHHSVTTFIMVALNENAKRAKILSKITGACSNPEFLLGLWKNYQKQKPRGNLMPKRYLHGLMTWKVMQRNAWKDIAKLAKKNNATITHSRDATHG